MTESLVKTTHVSKVRLAAQSGIRGYIRESLAEIERQGYPWDLFPAQQRHNQHTLASLKELR